MALASACSADPTGPGQSDVGGSASTGGASNPATSAPAAGTHATGGASAAATSASTGGAPFATGGAAAGGTSNTGKATGGGATNGGTSSKASGGALTTGGASNTGKTTGGASTSAGASSTAKLTGGAPASGGTGNGGDTSKATGGATTAKGGTGNGGDTSKATGGASTDGGTSSSSTGTPGNVYNPDFVEFSGADCKVTEPKDGKSSTLDDLFVNGDGVRMSKKSDWRCQRAYLKRVVEKYIEGDKPGTPTTVTGTVSKSSISVHVSHNNKTVDFSVSVSIPAGAASPAPIIIGLGGVSTMGGTASLASTVSGEGVATGNYDYSKISDEKSRSGLFSNIYGSTNASALIGWAWGISRVIDVLVAEKAAGRNNIIDPTAVGVYGCSRLGKGAFVIGAFDERIALGIPQESGTAGVSALKMIGSAPNGPNGKPAQSISSAMSEAAGWFGTVFSSYSSKVTSIPGDTHSIAAMYAPRGLIVIDNSRIGELCSTCQHGASAAAQKLYAALGIGSNIEYHGGLPKDPQDHCSFNTEQVAPLQAAIRAFLTKKAAPAGKMEPQSVATADLTKWITWTAPTLDDDMSFALPQ